MPGPLEVNLHFDKVIGMHTDMSYEETGRVWSLKMGLSQKKEEQTITLLESQLTTLQKCDDICWQFFSEDATCFGEVS